MNLIRLGSNYGGWVIPDIFDEKSICYFAGAGEDITFDVDFAKKYNCQVHIFDPTPRAIEHIQKVISSSITKEKVFPVPIDSDYSEYEISPLCASKILWHPIGLGKDEDNVVFYPPADESHVSYSIVNIQQISTGECFTASCRSLQTIMVILGHNKIDCLKMDIEGAELLIINEIITKKIFPSVLCVEFDFARKYSAPTPHAVELLLEEAGYSLFHNTKFEYTFVRNDIEADKND